MSIERRDHVLNAVASLLVPAASLLTAPLLARALGPTARGEFTVEQSLILAASSLFGLGISDVVATRWHAYSARHRFRLTCLNLGAALIFSGAGLIYLVLVATPSVLVMGLCLFAGGVFAAALAERGIALSRDDVRGVAVEKLLVVTARLALTVAAFAAGMLDLTVALVTFIAPQCVGLTYLWLRRYRDKRALAPRSNEPRAAAQLDWWTIVGGSGGVLLVNGIPLAAFAAIGPTEVGYFSVCILIAEVFTLVAKPFRDATFTSAYVSEWPKLRRLIWFTLVVLVGIGLLAGAVMWFAVPLVFGSDFTPAVPAAYAMILAGVLKGWGYQLNGALTVRGDHRVRAASTYSAVIVNVLLLFAFAASGALGAALACLVAYGVMAGWSAWSLLAPAPPGNSGTTPGDGGSTIR